MRDAEMARLQGGVRAGGAGRTHRGGSGFWPARLRKRMSRKIR
jgi:hypothetical protein